MAEQSPLGEPYTYNRRTWREKTPWAQQLSLNIYQATEVFTKLIEADRDPEAYEYYRQLTELSRLYKAMLDSTPVESAPSVDEALV